MPEYARVRELAADLAADVAAGDLAAPDRAAAAEELWERRLEYDHKPPAWPDLANLATKLGAVYQAERKAIDELTRTAATLR